jgi:hypothetical protein
MALLAGCSRTPHPNYQFEPRGSKVLQSIASYSADPQVGLSPSGIVDLLALYGTVDKSRLAMLVSHNGGDSFSSPIPISDADAEVRAQGESSPTLAVTSTAVYALWEQTNTAGLVQSEVEMGNPRVRPPRLELIGEELEQALCTIRHALHDRPREFVGQTVPVTK